MDDEPVTAIEPHPNGTGPKRPDDGTPPPAHGGRRFRWQAGIAFLAFLLVCIGIILGWTLIGSRSPERLDDASASAVNAICGDAETKLRALPNSSPTEGPDRVARIRSENEIYNAMAARVHTVEPAESTPAAALGHWADDWVDVAKARETYATTLETEGRARLVVPSETGIKPVTRRMDDFVREQHPRLDACFTESLQLERTEGERIYGETSDS